jgi:thymidylate synthase
MAMNNIEHDYLKLLYDVFKNGQLKEGRNGKTHSAFGRQIRHDMKLGFPLLTTKKMAWKQIVTELLWFLRGDTNIKFLVDNDCHIWDGDCYKKYCEEASKVEEPDYDIHVDDPHQNRTRLMTKEEFINKIKTDDEFAKKWGELGPIYGKQWRSWSPNYGHKWGDQISTLINELKTNPDSRRLMVNTWNVGELDQMVLPPCHYGFQVYTRELSARERTALGSNGRTKLYDMIKEGNHETIDADVEMHTICDEFNVPRRAISLMWNQRSADVFLGLPFNIASYGLLLKIIAKAVNMVPDELIGNIGDAHLYLNHIEQAKEQMHREPYPLPTLNINTEWWPTESGECSEGPLDATAVFHGFKNDHFCKCLLEEDIQLYKYQSHPTIKAPLSN